MPMDQYNLGVLTNIIGAVESGGQVYGQRDYAAYAGPGANTPAEHTVTLGWAQNYGPEAQELVRRILARDPAAFERLDNCEPSIEEMLAVDWTDTWWDPAADQRDVLVSLIDSPAGHAAQDELFEELMRIYISSCENDYTADIKAVMMYCEIRHLGGQSAADRIFRRCNGDYSLDKIMSSLVADQKDKSSSNQVGDTKFWSRHVKCYQFIEQYARDEKMDPMERAKILLRQQDLKVMTGYTPEGAQCFKNAKAWMTTPKPGDVVYFFGKPAGENYRICHTGIVESVNTVDKVFQTIEGNTSGGAFTTNGGSVARHTYSYASVGGSNRVNGFGVPDFTGAGITPEQLIAVARSYIGYEEKASNACLDDFHANAGRNNYQKFERDVIGWTGDQWCQYFVDACALYAARGEVGESSNKEEECMVALKELTRGASGSEVRSAQILLIHKFGISCGAAGADGDFGKMTDTAVRAFQKAHGLGVDGVVGQKTWTALLAEK